MRISELLGRREKCIHDCYLPQGEALEVYKTMGTEGRKNHVTVKETLQTAFRAEDQKLTALSKFHGNLYFPMKHHRGTSFN